MWGTILTGLGMGTSLLSGAAAQRRQQREREAEQGMKRSFDLSEIQKDATTAYTRAGIAMSGTRGGRDVTTSQSIEAAAGQSAANVYKSYPYALGGAGWEKEHRRKKGLFGSMLYSASGIFG